MWRSKMLHGFLSHHLASGASHSPLRQMGLGASQLPADILSKRLMFLFFFWKATTHKRCCALHLFKSQQHRHPLQCLPLYSFGKPKSFRIPNGGCKPPGVMWTFYQHICTVMYICCGSSYDLAYWHRDSGVVLTENIALPYSISTLISIITRISLRIDSIALLLFYHIYRL